MKFTAIIKDASPIFGGEVHVLCASRLEAIKRARRELKDARALGIECYAKVLPRRARPRKDFERLGWL